MEIERGSLVYSIAGRDKGNLFLVLKRDGDFVYLADGDMRKLENPKKKKIKHTNKTNTLLELDFDNISNSDIRKILKKV
ncbi:MAG: KOW domain-containing RNA-binding protein [Clostridia bacterium]|nr:KOW domain-containing RNA-binding protein [Clostridia bacterium]